MTRQKPKPPPPELIVDRRRGAPGREVPPGTPAGPPRLPFGGGLHHTSTNLLSAHLSSDDYRLALEEQPPLAGEGDPGGTRLWKGNPPFSGSPQPSMPVGHSQGGYPPESHHARRPPTAPQPIVDPALLREAAMTGPTPRALPGAAVPQPYAGVLGKLVVFFSSHGGTGTSTLASNAAATLARGGRTTALVDLDLQLGDALTMLGLEPKCAMSKLAREMTAFDWEVLGPTLARHSSGVSVVSQVGCLEELNELTVGRIPEILRYLQTHFEFVIVDGVRDFNDYALATMDVADAVVIVVTQDVPAVRGVSRRLSIFRRLGYSAAKLKVITNRYSKENPITLKAIANAIGMDPTFTVGNDFATVHRAITEGLALHEANPQASITRQIEELTAVLFDLPLPRQSRKAKPTGSPLLSRLFKKR